MRGRGRWSIWLILCFILRVDRYESYRILRGVKNRFGSTNEIGVFEMKAEGLVEVENPSEYMLSGKPEGASGSIVTCSIEGSRPILSRDTGSCMSQFFLINPKAYSKWYRL